MKLVECVPNISEGCDKKKIIEIASSILKRNVKLLDVSSDESHNRSVITFVGSLDCVMDAAFELIVKAANLIDMTKHKGEHPRMGAVDVCPFIPVSGVNLGDCVKIAHELGKKLSKVGISGYFYGYAAKKPERVFLSDIRKGEYEALGRKLKQKKWYPDFGTSQFKPKFGVVAIGARDFLVAYNINLQSYNFGLANNIARIIRGSGAISRIDGKKTRVPGVFSSVQAVGIDIREKGYVQVSMNLNNYKKDGILTVFEAVKRIAEIVRVDIQSSEIVGVVPEQAICDVPKKYIKLVGFDERKQIIEEVIK